MFLIMHLSQQGSAGNQNFIIGSIRWREYSHRNWPKPRRDCKDHFTPLHFNKFEARWQYNPYLVATD